MKGFSRFQRFGVLAGTRHARVAVHTPWLALFGRCRCARCLFR